ncbi:MAG: hypothetical protein ACREUU_20770 [Gammaproteobacteria bacterium]
MDLADPVLEVIGQETVMIQRLSTHDLIHYQKRFQELVERCNRDELAQCIRLLGMYLSLYKGRYGDVADVQYAELLSSIDSDAELERLFSRGLDEAIAMLTLIEGDNHSELTQLPAPRPMN